MMQCVCIAGALLNHNHTLSHTPTEAPLKELIIRHLSHNAHIECRRRHPAGLLPAP